MLSELNIRNFAIIDDLNLSLERGMTVLSGETGAGKSILIDALGLLLGDRADSQSVRNGQERAEITAAFYLHDAARARAWLQERELHTEDEGEEQECILRRVVSREGRSRNWINGAPANARDLAALGEFLVDIHGQHEHQSLLKPIVQREIVDEHGNHDPVLKAVADQYKALNELQIQIAKLEQIDGSGQSRLELLSYQVSELEALNLQADELDAIESEHRRLANAERLISEGQTALGRLYEDEETAAVNHLGTAQRLLEDLAQIDPGFEQAAQMTAGALIQTREAADDLRRVLDRLDVDPQRLAELDNRLSNIQDLARKHHCRPEQLFAHAQALSEELDTLQGAEAGLLKLRKQHEQAQEKYQSCTQKLYEARVKSAKKLGTEVSKVMHDLGMQQGVFEIAVSHDSASAAAAHGQDRISFMVSANPGQAPRPLERVASGGELSRISLAVQVIAAASTHVPTLVFDEVDAGIGGGVAEIVGRLLRRLGADRQALCVTHLPQVAAQAQQHLQVSKAVSKGQTRTTITPLSQEERIQELARMLGGVELTEQTRAHASEMLAQANG